MANKELVDLLLKDENAIVAKEEFETLTGSDWVRLLSKKPQFADKCDKWDEFKDHYWAHLLEEQPQFADKCDKWNEFDLNRFFFGSSWGEVLAKQPQLIEYFMKAEKKQM